MAAIGNVHLGPRWCPVQPACRARNRGRVSKTSEGAPRGADEAARAALTRHFTHGILGVQSKDKPPAGGEHVHRGTKCVLLDPTPSSITQDRRASTRRSPDQSATPPHTSVAVSTTSRSFCTCTSREISLPCTVLENPHCGDNASCSSGTSLAASSMRRKRSSFFSSAARFELTMPSTTRLPRGTNRSGAKLPERSSSYW